MMTLISLGDSRVLEKACPHSGKLCGDWCVLFSVQPSPQLLADDGLGYIISVKNEKTAFTAHLGCSNVKIDLTNREE